MSERTPPPPPPGAPAPRLIELRGASGRLYGMIDPQRMVIEFKSQRGGKGQTSETEQIDLRPYFTRGD